MVAVLKILTRTKNEVNAQVGFKTMGSDDIKFELNRLSNYSDDALLEEINPPQNPGCILHIDHIVPWSKDGKTEEKNLRTLCDQCNIGRGNKYSD